MMEQRKEISKNAELSMRIPLVSSCVDWDIQRRGEYGNHHRKKKEGEIGLRADILRKTDPSLEAGPPRVVNVLLAVMLD